MTRGWRDALHSEVSCSLGHPTFSLEYEHAHQPLLATSGRVYASTLLRVQFAGPAASHKSGAESEFKKTNLSAVLCLSFFPQLTSKLHDDKREKNLPRVQRWVWKEDGSKRTSLVFLHFSVLTSVFTSWCCPALNNVMQWNTSKALRT